ncbi:class I SAM-dependent methyltransferase [Tsuneonella sp. SYSU-LHT278]|uniref:class I SAM-dependent methyltransferase n=1 Tax=Tsuneonella sediminis TaxID=3416089 RepID=UPI003F79F46B
MRLLIAAAVSAIAIAAPAAAQDHSEHGAATHASHAALKAAVDNPNRDADRARDQYRHPMETLAFFQVEPGMKVGEYAPGGGWYSRVLGNYLGDSGQLVGLYFTPDGDAFSAEAQAGIRKGATDFPGKVAGWTGKPAARFSGLTLEDVSDADKGTFDRVLVIRMLHNMMRWNIADQELKVMRELLKPGGMLGVVQHRAPETADGDYAGGTKGYLRQKDVIGFVEAMGFELVGASEINANPRDTADHPQGVWEMPPTLSTKRDDLRGMGESDRMTLLFRKR